MKYIVVTSYKELFGQSHTVLDRFQSRLEAVLFKDKRQQELEKMYSFNPSRIPILEIGELE